jgi:hypothetical protein
MPLFNSVPATACCLLQSLLGIESPLGRQGQVGCLYSLALAHVQNEVRVKTIHALEEGSAMNSMVVEEERK